MAVIAVTSLTLSASRSGSRLGGDPNLKLIRGSRTLLRFLCELPMPAPPAETPQPPVITVCDKLAAGDR